MDCPSFLYFTIWSILWIGVATSSCCGGSSGHNLCKTNAIGHDHRVDAHPEWQAHRTKRSWWKLLRLWQVHIRWPGAAQLNDLRWLEWNASNWWICQNMTSRTSPRCFWWCHPPQSVPPHQIQNVCSSQSWRDLKVTLSTPEEWQINWRNW